jgi:hypothetical protein
VAEMAHGQVLVFGGEFSVFGLWAVLHRLLGLLNGQLGARPVSQQTQRIFALLWARV